MLTAGMIKARNLELKGEGKQRERMAWHVRVWGETEVFLLLTRFSYSGFLNSKCDSPLVVITDCYVSMLYPGVNQCCSSCPVSDAELCTRTLSLPYFPTKVNELAKAWGKS